MLPPPTSAKSLKPSDTHALAAAKKSELNKMAAALGTRSDYTEGDAFNREKQEELRQKHSAMPFARARSGKISAPSNQGVGPQLFP